MNINMNLVNLLPSLASHDYETQHKETLQKIRTLENLVTKCVSPPTGKTASELLEKVQEILSASLALISESQGIQLGNISLEAVDDTLSDKYTLDMELFLELLASDTQPMKLLRSIKSEEDEVCVDSESLADLAQYDVIQPEGTRQEENENASFQVETFVQESLGTSSHSCLLCIPNLVFHNEEELVSHTISTHVTVLSDEERLLNCPECENFAVRFSFPGEERDGGAWEAVHQVIFQHLLEAHSASATQFEAPDDDDVDNYSEEDLDNLVDTELPTKRRKTAEKKGRGGVCKICGKTIRCNLSAHKRLVHLKKTNLDCPECGKKYFHKRDLNQHLFTEHGSNSENLPVYACSQCPFKALRKFYYDRHIRSHCDDQRKKSFQCDKCGKKFKSQDTLHGHARLHDDLSKVPCPHCEFRGRNRSVVKHHIDTVHKKLRNLECAAECGFHAGFTSSLSNHHQKCPVFKKFITSVWDDSQKGFKCPKTLCEFITFFRGQFLVHYTKCKQKSKQ